ncbi:MAG: CPBP family intramembrane glutamic endopeptidase [Planctomycetota bacterium]
MLEAAHTLSKPLAQATLDVGDVPELTLPFALRLLAGFLVASVIATIVAALLGLLKRPEPWRPRVEGMPGVAGLIVGFVLLLGSMVFAGIVAAALGWTDSDNPLHGTAIGLVLYGSYIVGVVVWQVVARRQTLDLGLQPGKLPGGLLGTTWLVVILPWVWVAVMATLAVRLLLDQPTDEAHPLIDAMMSADDPLVLVVFVTTAVVAAPLAEEFFFRGVMQTGFIAGLAKMLDERPARWIGIVVTSLLFAVIHPPFSWPAIFVLSLFLGWLYERRGNLWTPVMVHAGFNALSTGIALLAR